MVVHNCTSVVMGEGQWALEEAMEVCSSLKKGVLYEIPNSPSAFRRYTNKFKISFDSQKFARIYL